MTSEQLFNLLFTFQTICSMYGLDNLNPEHGLTSDELLVLSNELTTYIVDGEFSFDIGLFYSIKG